MARPTASEDGGEADAWSADESPHVGAHRPRHADCRPHSRQSLHRIHYHLRRLGGRRPVAILRHDPHLALTGREETLPRRAKSCLQGVRPGSPKRGSPAEAVGRGRTWFPPMTRPIASSTWSSIEKEYSLGPISCS